MLSRTIAGLLGAGLLAAGLGVAGQSPFAGLGVTPAGHGAKKASVEFLFPEQVTVAAGKPTAVELHFRVAPGLHINSHSTGGDGMIPTTLTVPDGAAVRLVKTSFPAGAEFALPAAPAEKLSVYTGEFVVRAELEAAAGDHLMEATLRYQACDNAACMPPRTIPVVVDVVAR